MRDSITPSADAGSSSEFDDVTGARGDAVSYRFSARTTIAENLDSAMAELRYSATPDAAADLKFSRLAARRLSVEENRGMWQRYAAGSRLLDLTRESSWDLPQKATVSKFRIVMARATQEPLGEFLARSGGSTSYATTVFLSKLRESLIEKAEIAELTKTVTKPGTAEAVHRGPSGITEVPSFVSDTNLGRDTLNQAKLDAVSLDKVVELLRKLLGVARDYATDVVTMIQQYLEWVILLRDRLMEGSRRRHPAIEVDQIMRGIDRGELEQSLSRVPVGFGEVEDECEGLVGVPLAPAFNHPGLDRTFRETMEMLLQSPAELAGR